MVRIVQVGLGPLGLRTSREFLERGLGELVAAVDPALGGTPLAELVEGAPAGLTVVPDLDGVADWGAVDLALVTTRSALPDCADTFRQLFERGVHVVSSCEELAYPYLQHAELSEELDRLARGARCVLLGTGVNPGFLLDALPVMLSGVCHEVRGVVAGRVQDATTRRIPFQKKIGATLSMEAFQAEVEKGTLRHVGLPESLHFLADHLGIRFDSWSETLDPVVAETDMECGLGPIPKGHAAGVRQVATAVRDGREVIRLEFQAAIGQEGSRDWVSLDSDPPVRMVIEGGVHGDAATSSILLNAIGSALEAPPGLHTMATVRPPRCQAPR
jgi:4-hydroxy-tetrahydrodipicolinate reductase